MSNASQPLSEDNRPLSPWRIRAAVIVMVLGFTGLLTITMLAYRHAPPIPARVMDAQGLMLFSGDEISEGQAVFLKYGLMANGSIRGQGASLGPDYSAEAIAHQRYQQPLATLTPSQQAAVQAETTLSLKTNRYDAATDTLHLTVPETAADRQQIYYWTEYFRHPSRNGGLKPGLITDPTGLQQFTAFVTWAAWASVASRPGEDYFYTHNSPSTRQSVMISPLTPCWGAHSV